MLWRQVRSRVNLPRSVIISDDGVHLAYVLSDGLQLLDGRDGRVLRTFPWRDPALQFEGVRAGWFSGATCYFETGTGRLLACDQQGNLSFLEGSDMVRVLDEGIIPDISLRLAALWRLELRGGWVSACRQSSDERVRTSAAAYACSRGEAWGREGIEGDPSWLLLAHRSHFDFRSWPGYIPRWLGPEFEQGCLRHLESSRSCVAAEILGELRCRAAVPALWRMLDLQNNDSGLAVRALVLILGPEATPGFCQRLSRYPAPLLRFFCTVPCPEVVPGLVDCLSREEQIGQLAESALAFQTRLHLGADPGPWREWLASPDRGAFLADHGEPSGLLWLAHKDDPSLPRRLCSQPRLVSLFANCHATRAYFRGDELALASGWSGDRVLSRDLATGAPRRFLEPGLPEDSRWEASWDGSAVVAMIGTEQYEVRLPDSPPRRFDGTMGALSADGVWLWTYHIGTPLNSWSRLTNLRTGECFDFDGWARLDQAGHFLGQAGLWLLDGARPRQITDRPVRAASPDGTHVLLEDLEILGAGQKIQTHGQRADIRVSNRQIAVNQIGDRCETIALYDWSGRPLATLQARSLLDYSPDGRLLAVASDRGVEVLDTVTLRVQAVVPSPGFWTVTFSPDNRYLALSTEDAVEVWELHPDFSLEGQDPVQVTELWTGLRLQGGMAVKLTPEQFWARERRMSSWFYGPAVPRRSWENPAAVLALTLLGLAWLAIRRFRCR